MVTIRGSIIFVNSSFVGFIPVLAVRALCAAGKLRVNRG